MPCPGYTPPQPEHGRRESHQGQAGHDPIRHPGRQDRDQPGQGEMPHPVRNRLPLDRVDRSERRLRVKRPGQDLGVVNVGRPILGHEPGYGPDRGQGGCEALRPRTAAPRSPAGMACRLRSAVAPSPCWSGCSTRDESVTGVSLFSTAELPAPRGPPPASFCQEYSASIAQAPKNGISACLERTIARVLLFYPLWTG